MKIYTVWTKNRTGVGKCLLRENGDFISVETGEVFKGDDHYPSEIYPAKIVGVDKENNTGMYHLYKEWDDNEEENRYSFKVKYIGCLVTVEKAHSYGDVKVYRCKELNEYFTSNEIELVK